MKNASFHFREANFNNNIQSPILFFAYKVDEKVKDDKYLVMEGVRYKLRAIKINDDSYFLTHKFIEMIIVLVKIRKKISRGCYLWMTQDKGILISFSILPVKVISGEMTELLE
jgi:hypothetical protein